MGEEHDVRYEVRDAISGHLLYVLATMDMAKDMARQMRAELGPDSDLAFIIWQQRTNGKAVWVATYGWNDQQPIDWESL